jgi:hypothetical protein
VRQFFLANGHLVMYANNTPLPLEGDLLIVQSGIVEVGRGWGSWRLTLTWVCCAVTVFDWVTAVSGVLWGTWWVCCSMPLPGPA